MTYEEFCEKHKNLLYAPLKIELPKLDLEKFIDWSLTHRSDLVYRAYVYGREKYAPGQEILSESKWLERNQKNFWESYYPLLGNEWICNFDNLFPELIDLFNSLPLTTLGTTGYLYQNNNSLDLKSGPIHTDERSGYGIRITYSNDTHGLFFHRPKLGIDINEHAHDFMIRKDREEYVDPLDDYGMFKVVDGEYVINDDLLDPKRIYAQPPNKTAQAFLFSNDLAPHAVIKRSSPSITFACFGKRNHKERFVWSELDKLLTASFSSYQDNFIYL